MQRFFSFEGVNFNPAGKGAGKYIASNVLAFACGISRGSFNRVERSSQTADIHVSLKEIMRDGL
jgi:hypothetical protein